MKILVAMVPKVVAAWRFVNQIVKNNRKAKT